MTPDPNELMPDEITEALRIIELHMGFYCCKDDRLFLEKSIRASHPREVKEVTVEELFGIVVKYCGERNLKPTPANIIRALRDKGCIYVREG